MGGRGWQSSSAGKLRRCLLMSRVHCDCVAPSLPGAATAGTWIPAFPRQEAQGAWEPAAPQLSQRGGLAGVPSSPSPGWGHHDMTSVGVLCPRRAEDHGHLRRCFLLSTSASLPPRSGCSQATAHLVPLASGASSEKWGRGPGSSKRVLLGPRATLLCAEDQQHDAGGRGVLPLWPVAMRPTGHPTPQARCRQDSAGTSGGRRLQSHRDDCQAAWSHAPPLPHGQAFHLFIKPGFQ